MQVNTQIFVDLSTSGHVLWSCPVLTVLAFIILWFYIGAAVFASVSALLVLMLISAYFTRKYNQGESEKLRYKNSKLKLINEVLNGIKV